MHLLHSDVLFGDDAAVHNCEAANAGQHQALQDLRAQAGRIDDAHLGALKQRLAMVAPQSATYYL